MAMPSDFVMARSPLQGIEERAEGRVAAKVPPVAGRSTVVERHWSSRLRLGGDFAMFTTRNVGGMALFLFGTTFLWLTPSFASPGVSTQGVPWSITQVLALVTIALFTAATWGLFRKAGWWEPVAVVSAIVGFIVLIPYWIAAGHAGEANPEFNVLIHALGNVGVLVLLLVPSLEHWVDGHVLAGR
jgi:hypothetical protein